MKTKHQLPQELLDDLHDDIRRAIGRIESYCEPKELDPKGYNTYTSLLITLANISIDINSDNINSDNE